MKTFLPLLCLFCFSAAAQVGFNNPAPHPSSILDLTANDKGLLIPRMSKTQREAISSPALGLLVFELPSIADNNNRGSFYYYNGVGWFSLNEWDRAEASTNLSLTGNASVSGNVSAGSLVVSGFSTNALVPSGGIIMWAGSLGSIPTGWTLCDGNNGTPDLRDRFIVGAGNSYGVGVTGGQNSVALTTNEMPSHSHSGFTSTNGSHSHTIGYQVKSTRNQDSSGTWENGNSTSKSTSTDGAHSHSFVTNSIGGGLPFDNRPLFYAIAYIMKL
ncbi:MAG: hypothetical protein K2U26_09625 [Cyclobacteriaceae bacterium]|nr:hypothetical protein [Cyclobacteriaceae bacterium]